MVFLKKDLQGWDIRNVLYKPYLSCGFVFRNWIVSFVVFALALHENLTKQIWKSLLYIIGVHISVVVQKFVL